MNQATWAVWLVIRKYSLKENRPTTVFCLDLNTTVLRTVLLYQTRTMITLTSEIYIIQKHNSVIQNRYISNLNAYCELRFSKPVNTVKQAIYQIKKPMLCGLLFFSLNVLGGGGRLWLGRVLCVCLFFFTCLLVGGFFNNY